MIPTLSAPVAAPKQIAPQSAGATAPEKTHTAFEKDKPTGPPPSFDESFLTRQAREALNPREIPRDWEVSPDGKSSPEGRAESGFAEIRALAGEPAKPIMDKRS